MKKRNQAVDLTDLALGIIILGIVVSIGSNILVSLANSRVTKLPVSLVSNESITLNEEVNYNFPNLYFNSVVECLDSNNGTAAIVVNTDNANYTTSVNSFGEGTVNWTVGASALNGTTVYCNYNIYNLTDPQYATANSAATGLGEYGNWFDILVIVGIAGLVLAIVFMTMGGRGKTATNVGGSY